jgi:hypothetical protein
MVTTRSNLRMFCVQATASMYCAVAPAGSLHELECLLQLTAQPLFNLIWLLLFGAAVACSCVAKR